MLGIVLKDLYNILNNIKSLVLILFVLAITFLPNLGVESYITTYAIVCSMIIITTMNFDYNSKWDKFALTTPISRKDIVISKYISLFIFILFGTIFSSLISLISSLFIKNIALSKILESIPISIFIVMFFQAF